MVLSTFWTIFSYKEFYADFTSKPLVYVGIPGAYIGRPNTIVSSKRPKVPKYTTMPSKVRKK